MLAVETKSVPKQRFFDLPAGQASWKIGQTTTKEASRSSPGTGNPRARRDSSTPWMASLMLAKASARVRPCVAQPSRLGTSATHQPSSSLWRKTWRFEAITGKWVRVILEDCEADRGQELARPSVGLTACGFGTRFGGLEHASSRDRGSSKKGGHQAHQRVRPHRHALHSARMRCNTMRSPAAVGPLA